MHVPSGLQIDDVKLDCTCPFTKGKLFLQKQV
jgi:hypothetical protein